MDEQSDPGAIRSIAVRADDVVTAVERTLRSEDDVVLRITPPFSGRMRARLHRVTTGEYGESAPIHVDPIDLIEALPAYPEPAETEDELRADPERKYTPGRHREYHREVVDQWRESVRDRIIDETVLQWDDDSKRVAVKRLG